MQNADTKTAARRVQSANNDRSKNPTLQTAADELIDRSATAAMEAARKMAPPDAARSSPPLWLSFDKCTAKKRGRQLAPSMRHKENERGRVALKRINSSDFDTELRV